MLLHPGDNPWRVGRQLQRLSSDCISNLCLCTSTINDKSITPTYRGDIGMTFLTHHLDLCCLLMSQVNISASQHRLDPPSHCSKWGEPWTRCSYKKTASSQVLMLFLVTYSRGGEGKVTLQGWETTQRARSEPFSLEQLWQPWLDARWDV